jgi:2'-5' RNA ligase
MIVRVRLFVAIFLPENITSKLASLPRSCPLPRLRWTAPASLHLTLRFLGDTDIGKVASIENVLLEATRSRPGFRLLIADGGVFPNPRRPRIFWMGLGGAVDALTSLAADIESGIRSVGYPAADHAFKPHLTLARCRSEVNCQPDDADCFVKSARALGNDEFDVRTVELVRSHLSGAGARYERLQSFPLAA